MEDIHNISNVNSTLQSKVIDIKATLPIVQVNTGGGGLVNDVLVNGESVVTDRIAYITLPENLEDRLTAIESKYINEIISKINGSVSLSKSVFYAGYPININVVGTLSLPTEVSSNYVSNIMLSGNQTTVSDNGVTQVSINNTNITDNTTFSLSASISSPYTKSISKQATINKVCPIYIAIVDNNVDTVEKAITAIKKDANRGKRAVMQMQQQIHQIYIKDIVYDYIIKLVTATRHHPYIERGASPRATIALVKTAKAYAWLQGRQFVVPADVIAQLPYVLFHRLSLSMTAKMSGSGRKDILDDILRRTPQPHLGKPS